MGVNAFSLEGEFDLLIKDYGQDILKYCHNILCDYHEAEDVVQVTFMKAYKKRNTFKGSTSVSAWLYRIAYTTCIDTLRKKRLYSFFVKEEDKKIIAKEENYISEELKQSLLKLKPEERGLIFNRVMDDKSYSELEIIYNTSAATLRKRYERAKRKLAADLIMEGKNEFR